MSRVLTRFSKIKYFKIAAIIVSFLIFQDFRVFDKKISGAPEKITFNTTDMEVFERPGAIEIVNIRKLHSRSTGDDLDEAKELETKTSLRCRENPPNLIGNISFETGPPHFVSFKDIEKANPNVANGGHFAPNCKARHKVAIIIPFRDREHQLRILLAHMHPIWKRQQIDYKVFLITQAGDGIFNKAKLMNIGVAEAEKDGTYDCYVFHDVDLLLEDDRCLYWCHKDNPRHLSVYLDTFAYTPYTYHIRCPPLSRFLHERIYLYGGVTMLTPEQFQTVNGFSNLHWGWGGEDDDLYLRIRNKGYHIDTPYGRHCSYRMAKHNHDTKTKNKGALPLLFYSTSRMDVDGYETLRYIHISTVKNRLFTNITVDVGQPSFKMKKFMSYDTDYRFLFGCSHEMPWES